MRGFILTIVFFSNVVGGIEIASDYKDVCADYRVSAITDELPTVSADNPNNPSDTVDCDHCCHSGAHFAGLVAL